MLNQVKILWKKEYLQFLAERNANQRFNVTHNSKEPRKGDVALIEGKNYKRSHWPFAIIEDCQRSSDGKVRACVVRLPTGVKLIRPTKWLFFMELNPEDENVAPGIWKINPNKE